MEPQKLELPVFKTQDELLEHLVANKAAIIAQKKCVFKHSDSQPYLGPIDTKTKQATKAQLKAVEGLDEATALAVKATWNTTNWLDSHNDVHIPGLWNKTLQENKNLMHVQEHQAYKFSHIIADGPDLQKVYVESKTWQELGLDIEGTTEALQAESIVKLERNAEMFKAYGKGWVKSHSVGMRYDKVILCINQEKYGAEYEAWEKYYPQIINKELADARGWFWAVTKARLFEGSAVPLGSNVITPTNSVTISKNEPPKGTHITEAEKAAKALQAGQNQFYTNLLN